MESIKEQLKILKNYLDENKILYKYNHYVKYETYFKQGGLVKLFIAPQDYTKFKNIILFLNNQFIDYKVLGFTSNIIMFDEIIYSVVVSTKNLTALEVENNKIKVDAGYALQDLVRVAILNQSIGYEGLEGIPASVGGSIFMNAGAYGFQIADNLVSVECINDKNELQIFDKDDCKFSYRNSIFMNKKLIILRAIFSLKKGNKKTIEKNVETFHIARHLYQDFVYPNLGSMISINQDIYKIIFQKDPLYYAVYMLFKYTFKNPISKFFLRKKPNNRIFNWLLYKYLNNKLNIKLKYSSSIKSANILINDGTLDSEEIVSYMFLISKLVGKDWHIENELILNPMYSVDSEFKKVYKSLKNKQEKVRNK